MDLILESCNFFHIMEHSNFSIKIQTYYSIIGNFLRHTLIQYNRVISSQTVSFFSFLSLFFSNITHFSSTITCLLFFIYVYSLLSNLAHSLSFSPYIYILCIYYIIHYPLPSYRVFLLYELNFPYFPVFSIFITLLIFSVF